MAGVKLLLLVAVAFVSVLSAWSRPDAGDQLSRLRVPQLFDCPPENPFCPVWVPCNFTEVQGPTCGDCHTRVICTPVGGLVRPCLPPFRPHCVEGRCSSTPSDDCNTTPPPPPPPETTEQEITPTEPTTAKPDSQ